jgi:hypothetical protein
MKTYQIKLFNPLISIVLLFGFIAIVVYFKVSILLKPIPNLYPILGSVLSLYLSYKLTEGVMSIEVMDNDLLKIRYKRRPVIGYFRERDIKVEDIESYKFRYNNLRDFLRIYLRDGQEIVLRPSPSSAYQIEFFSDFNNIISDYNKRSHIKITHRQKKFGFTSIYDLPEN